MREIGCPDDV